MANWRDTKAKMLKVVHRTFTVPAVYLPTLAGAPIRVNVRVHRKPSVDRLTFGDFNDMAEAYASEDVIMFDLAEISPLPKSYLFIGSKEIYSLGATKVVQDGYMPVAVTELPADAAAKAMQQVDTSAPEWKGVGEW